MTNHSIALFKKLSDEIARVANKQNLTVDFSQVDEGIIGLRFTVTFSEREKPKQGTGSKRR